MEIKGYWFESYIEEDKNEAVRLNVRGELNLQADTGYLKIQHKDKVEKWMLKYRELGEFDYWISEGTGRNISIKTGIFKSSIRRMTC